MEHGQEMDRNSHSLRYRKWIEYGPFVLAFVAFLCCLVIELCDISISNENRNRIYDIMCLVLTVFGIFLNAGYGRHYGLAWRKSLRFSFVCFFLLFICLAEAWTRIDILILGRGSTAAFRSIIFLPLLCKVLSRYCGQDKLNLCDYFTPYFFYTLGFTALNCWLVGCCAGKEWPWGVVNPLSGCTVFPTQICFVALSLTISFWGLRYAKKCAYKTNGMVFANSLCIYGFFRYLIELFSDDARVFGVLSLFSVYSLVMLAQGFLVRRISENRYQTP